MMRAYFQGDLPVLVAAGLAIAVAVSLGWYYARETRVLPLPHRWLLPILRGLAIGMVLLMLTGPMIEYRRETGKVATVNVFVDATDSMRFTDPDRNENAQAIDDSGVVSSPERKSATRYERALDLLLGNGKDKGWLAQIRDTHRIKLFLLGGESSQPIFDSQSSLPLPESIPSDALQLDRSRTDLAAPIGDRVDAGTTDSTTSATDVVVLLSDGQHNVGRSPEEFAKQLGDAKVPVFTIGFGQSEEPIDLAVLDIDTPPLVASTGRAAGSIAIKDLGTPGTKFRLRITTGDETIWQQTLTSEMQPSRRIAFDFSVADVVAKLRRPDRDAPQRLRLTIPLQVSIEPIEGEYDVENNTMQYRLSASTRTRRMLILDSRSRWETRYIRNLFDRDPTWQVQTIILWPDQGSLSSLDEGQAAFPADQKTLSEFDVIVWGDVDGETVSEEQLRLVRDFVSLGGGIVFVDGDRDHLSFMTRSPLGELIPVRYRGNHRVDGPLTLALTPTGAERAAMSLSPAGPDADANQAVWSGLVPPTAIRYVEALPGSEVWLEATAGATNTPVPLIVTRLFGGGQVVYLSTDQTWRWRYRVADLYHARFWNQLVEAIMQPPFDVRDEYISLSTGSPQYREGERATIRTQLRDAAGNAVSDAIVDVVLQPDSGTPLAVPLRLLDAARGIYQGESEPLATGDYNASVRTAGYSSSAVTSSFLVSQPPNRENFRLAQNAQLLATMAQASGGLYADELNAKMVWQAIAPLSDGKIEIKKWSLAQSYFWFVAVMCLLTLEWWLRKKVGLV